MEFITLQQHDIRWAGIFKVEEQLIFKALGESIVRIHHVGSTAVPDLLAKPIIDIAIESVFYPPTQKIVDKLGAIGYECRGEAGINGRFWFIKGRPRIFNLHVCLVGSAVVQHQIAFRNKLLNYAPFRREYEMLKLKNYQKRDIDSPDYSHAKSDYIRKVIYSEISRYIQPA
jgi:GrpB-like predicted nucleotidyltransferase (UPF0157 family)